MKVMRPLAVGLVVALALAPVRLEAQQESPKGWVGVLITTGIGERGSSGRFVFPDYPVIESIDPGSPAEKAGLQVGDVLISINAQDFKLDPIPMNDLLVPGKRIVFRYRRDRVERMTRMIVAERPAGTSRTIQIVTIDPLPNQTDLRRKEVEGVMSRKAAVRVPMPPMISIAPLTLGTGIPSIAIAGAELTRLNGGLRDYVKVKGDGLFVVNVLLGTPAQEAGLRGGDVIVKAANQPLQNPGQLIRLMAEAADRSVNSVQLLVLRQNKERKLTLRW